MSERKQEKRPETKAISVRLPLDEAERIDQEAAAASLTRNDYLRMRLEGKRAVLGLEKLDEIIGVLRQIERVFDRYLDVLEELASLHRATGDAAALARTQDEIEHAQALIDLAFKAQSQAVGILRLIRRKVVR